MKVALFMGAGFSARFGYPVVNIFFDVAEKTVSLTDRERELSLLHLLFIDRDSSFVQMDRQIQPPAFAQFSGAIIAI